MVCCFKSGFNKSDLKEKNKRIYIHSISSILDKNQKIIGSFFKEYQWFISLTNQEIPLENTIQHIIDLIILLENMLDKKYCYRLEVYQEYICLLNILSRILSSDFVSLMVTKQGVDLKYIEDLKKFIKIISNTLQEICENNLYGYFDIFDDLMKKILQNMPYLLCIGQHIFEQSHNTKSLQTFNLNTLNEITYLILSNKVHQNEMNNLMNNYISCEHKQVKGIEIFKDSKKQITSDIKNLTSKCQIFVLIKNFILYWDSINIPNILILIKKILKVSDDNKLVEIMRVILFMSKDFLDINVFVEYFKKYISYLYIEKNIKNSKKKSINNQIDVCVKDNKPIDIIAKEILINNIYENNMLSSNLNSVTHLYELFENKLQLFDDISMESFYSMKANNNSQRTLLKLMYILGNTEEKKSSNFCFSSQEILHKKETKNMLQFLKQNMVSMSYELEKGTPNSTMVVIKAASSIATLGISGISLYLIIESDFKKLSID